jgi:hypothetical protein
MSAPVFEAPVVTVPELDDGSGDDDLVHWTCCEDDEVSLCGDDPGPEVPDDVPVSCPTCIEVGGTEADSCPPNYCPVSALRSLKGTL